MLFVTDNHVIRSDHVGMSRGTKPVVYLKSNVLVKSGDGTDIKPYQLEI